MLDLDKSNLSHPNCFLFVHIEIRHGVKFFSLKKNEASFMLLIDIMLGLRMSEMFIVITTYLPCSMQTKAQIRQHWRIRM